MTVGKPDGRCSTWGATPVGGFPDSRGSGVKPQDRTASPTHWLPDQPLPASGEERQSVALAGWRSLGDRK
ncbi:hypothetical protein [Tolypothrix sp. VBCCA 56010]|uniref:hypothetical protein n=1 Tax=Tolypothrix sp. VBCCA 56010 TaxID=3137731 RepID=UPI003D7CA6FE